MNKQQIKEMVKQYNTVVDACIQITIDAKNTFDKILVDLDLNSTFTKAEVSEIHNKKYRCPLISDVFNQYYVFAFQEYDPSNELGKIEYSEDGVHFIGGDHFESWESYSTYGVCIPYDILELKLNKLKQSGVNTAQFIEAEKTYKKELDRKLRTFVSEIAVQCGFEAKKKQEEAIKRMKREMDRLGITSQMLEGK